MSDPGKAHEWTQEQIDAQMFEDDDCANCGGEGYTHDCFDGFCLDADEGCDLCTRRCDWCNSAVRDQPDSAGV